MIVYYETEDRERFALEVRYVDALDCIARSLLAMYGSDQNQLKIFREIASDIVFDFMNYEEINEFFGEDLREEFKDLLPEGVNAII